MPDTASVVHSDPELLGVVVLRAESNALEDLLPLIPAALAAIEAVQPGQLVRVGT